MTKIQFGRGAGLLSPLLMYSQVPISSSSIIYCIIKWKEDIVPPAGGNIHTKDKVRLDWEKLKQEHHCDPDWYRLTGGRRF